jgi:hypothetical protein
MSVATPDAVCRRAALQAQITNFYRTLHAIHWPPMCHVHLEECYYRDWVQRWLWIMSVNVQAEHLGLMN